MRRAVITGILFMLCGAAHGISFGPNDTNSCFVKSNFWGRRWYWFCGSQSQACRGYSPGRHAVISSYYHGQSFTEGSTKYFCCDGSASAAGHFIKADAWETVSTETVSLDGGGSCSYQKRVDVCGNELSKPCDKPTSCSEGKILRNGECIEPCMSGYGFDSDSSNTCVQCDTTNFQGLRAAQDASQGNICLKCDAARQFFDREKSKCVNRGELEQYSKDKLYNCHGCQSNELYVKCVKMLNSSNPSSNKDYNSIVSECKLKL